ncbi:MAG TPA: 50S ribosome-binding GTPase [Baekduia sp.]|nr:50S ribosome-binding GTPase [Baekduia sp.]
MSANSDLILSELERVNMALASAGVPDAATAEVRSLAERAPDDVSVAVVGPHSAGKTTLIAVLTADPKAAADISSVVQTNTSVSYSFSRNGTTFTLWDTPGLGSEYAEHDAEARDRITKADAVIVAMSTMIGSQLMRDEVAELLKVGRKRGAILPVVTKADAAPAETLPAIAESLVSALPEMGEKVRFVSARDVLDGLATADETGIADLADALTVLALGEARNRIDVTAAVRLLALIDQAQEALAANEPDHAAALHFQRRMTKLLTKTDRRLAAAVAAAARKERLAAYRATATIGQALDEATSREAIDVSASEAWDGFVSESEQRAEELNVALGNELVEAGAELDRLEQGPLASALKEYATELGVEGFEVPDSVDAPDSQTAEAVLKAARRASVVLRGIKVTARGKPVPVAGLVDAALEGLDWAVESRQLEQIERAKEAIRTSYSGQAETIIESWDDQLAQLRDETTRAALNHNAEIEQRLYDQLTNVQGDLRGLGNARTTLDNLVTEAIASGYGTAG